MDAQNKGEGGIERVLAIKQCYNIEPQVSQACLCIASPTVLFSYKVQMAPDAFAVPVL